MRAVERASEIIYHSTGEIGLYIPDPTNIGVETDDMRKLQELCGQLDGKDDLYGDVLLGLASAALGGWFGGLAADPTAMNPLLALFLRYGCLLLGGFLLVLAVCYKKTASEKAASIGKQMKMILCKRKYSEQTLADMEAKHRAEAEKQRKLVEEKLRRGKLGSTPSEEKGGETA